MDRALAEFGAAAEGAPALPCRLICARLCCCCANGTRFTAAGCAWLKKRPFTAFDRGIAAVARSETRKLAAVGAIGTCPLTKLAWLS